MIAHGTYLPFSEWLLSSRKPAQRCKMTNGGNGPKAVYIAIDVNVCLFHIAIVNTSLKNWFSREAHSDQKMCPMTSGVFLRPPGLSGWFWLLQTRIKKETYTLYLIFLGRLEVVETIPTIPITLA